MATITVHYFAGARAAAGCSQEQFVAGSVAELTAAIEQEHAAMKSVLAVSSLLIDGVQAHPDNQFPADAQVDVLPPFAGG